MRLLLRAFEFTGYAIRNLVGYPLRSFLTTLGVVFGIASVVAMLALGRGAEEELLRDIEAQGISNVIVNSIKPPENNSANTQRSWVSRYGITFKDMAQIRETVPGIARVVPVHSYSEQCWYGSKRENVEVVGVPPEYFDVVNRSVVAGGRTFSAADEANALPVCIVHAQLLRSLGWYGDPLGFKMRIGNVTYEVVGLVEDEEFRGLARKALGSPQRGENQVFAPYGAVMTRVGTMSVKRSSGSREASNIELNSLIVEVADKDNVVAVARMVRAILEKFHEEKDYEIVVPLELLAQARRTSEVFKMMLLVIAGISLLVGGIGIANIMLATVTERTREIGVRRAIGAKRIHILIQFLTETVTLSAAGGVLGVLVGIGGVELLRAKTGYDATFSPDVAGIALLVSCGVGILSGLFPAWRASRLDPIQALRYE